jgi:hypothetical protein
MTGGTTFAGVRVLLLCGLLGPVSGCIGGKAIPSPPTAPTTTTATLTGPFTLAGCVKTATGGSLPGATVSATWASGSASTVSAQSCAYTLQVPTPGDVTVRAEKDGYDPQERTLTIACDVAQNFALVRTLPADQYRLTFTASPSCSLPPELTSRQYTADLVMEPSGVATVYLERAGMFAFGEAGFTGVRDGNTLRFQVSGEPFDDYAFVELLEVGRTLSFSGTMIGTFAGDRIDATFDGTVRLTQYPDETTIAECTAADHRMEFVR